MISQEHFASETIRVSRLSVMNIIVNSTRQHCLLLDISDICDTVYPFPSSVSVYSSLTQGPASGNTWATSGQQVSVHGGFAYNL